MDELKTLPLDHVGIAVESFESALPTFELVTGATGSRPERIASQGVEVVFVGHGDARLELLRPTAPDSAIARFLKRRGQGLHHLAYRVEDIRAELERLTRAGLEPIDSRPRPGAGGHNVAFLHPDSTGRVLIELVETGTA